MMEYGDIFFSYHTDSSVSIVQETAKTLEAFDIRSWFAKRDIKATQNYTNVIPDAIDACKLFVLILNKYSMKSTQVTREVNIAMDKFKPILIINIDNSPLSDNSIVYVSAASSQVVTVTESNRSVMAQKICQNIIEWFRDNDNNVSGYDNTSLTKYKMAWDVNSLEFYGDEGERHRIETQHRFVHAFAKDVYENLLFNVSDASFLDVGCNTGVQVKMFLENKPIKYYVGIDREKAALEQAALTFPNGHLYLCDCEAEDFSERLTAIERELGIDGFDFINLSLILLHTKNPSILIDVLSDHLAENGQMIILDIDDGFNVAYPDPEGMFEKAIQLCFKTEYSGFRHCGRAINKFLSDTDMNNITLHKIGLSSIGMSRKEKEDFYDVYFWFILDDLRKMNAENPSDAFIKADYEWLKENYGTMKNCFKKRDFFFSLGFVIYSAQAE